MVLVRVRERHRDDLAVVGEERNPERPNHVAAPAVPREAIRSLEKAHEVLVGAAPEPLELKNFTGLVLFCIDAKFCK